MRFLLTRSRNESSASKRGRWPTGLRRRAESWRAGRELEIGVDVEIAPNVLIGDRVSLGDGVSIGANAVLGDDIRLGRGVVVEPGAVIGKIPRLTVRSRHPLVSEGQVTIGDGVAVCAYALVYVDVTIGAGSVAGDHSVIREGTRIGEQSVFGRGCGTAPGVRIGSRVRVQAGSGLAPDSIVEDDVFIGPSLISLDDDTAGRWQDSQLGPRGVTLRRGCRIGGGVTLMPGVEIGEDAMVAAGSLVTCDVAARSLAMGRPARFERELQPVAGELV